MAAERSIAERLCTSCGMCCNGVLFRDVELTAADAATLKSLGMPLRKRGKKVVMDQPCQALNCNFCRIYNERPGYCREFECALFKSTIAGETRPEGALKIIKSTQKRAEKVRVLLRGLGNTDEQIALSKRFKQVTLAFDRGELPDHASGIYGDLTIAMHELNYQLSTEFYPGSGE